MYSLSRYLKEQSKTVLSKMSSLFCKPLSRSDTRRLPFLESVYGTDDFNLNYLKINGRETQLQVTVSYPNTILFRTKQSPDQNLLILPTGGICVGKDIISNGFTGQQSYNVLGFCQSFSKAKRTISGTIIANWPHRFLTYGDFILQLLPEFCLIKSMISHKEWLNARFIIPQTPKFLIEYLNLLGCSSSQIINSRNYCFNVLPEATIYFREKDPMWFLCAPFDLTSITRSNFISNELRTSKGDRNGEILFVERLGGYRKAVGLTKEVRARLKDIGVSFIDPACISIEAQIDAFAHAKMVVGIHGAGLANIIWCKQNTRVIEIFHPNFSPWCYAILANQIGLEYYCLGGIPGHMNINFRESNVDVDWDGLHLLIQKLKNSIT